MYARVTIVQVKIDKMDEAVKIFEESVVPAAKSQNGFNGCYLLSDPKTGKGMAITLWETENDANTNEQSGYYQSVLAPFKDIFAAPPIREGYEVKVHP